MPGQEVKISPTLVIAGGLGIAAVLGLAALAWAAPPTPPPEGWGCPYCPDVFATYEELVAHVTSEHPGERIPLPIEWE